MADLDEVIKATEENNEKMRKMFQNNPEIMAELTVIDERLKEQKDDIRCRKDEIDGSIEANEDRKDELDVLAIEMLSAEKEAAEARHRLLERSYHRLQDEIEEKKRKQDELQAKLGRLKELNNQLVQAKVNETKKIYPNDPCPCGSGKKYKKCCGRI